MNTAPTLAEPTLGPGAWAIRNADQHNNALGVRAAKLSARAKVADLSGGTGTPIPYALERFTQELRVIFAAGGITEDPYLTLVERAKFSADFCVSVPSLLKRLGSKEYTSDFVPKLSALISSSALVTSGRIQSVATKGIYVNLLASDGELFSLLADREARGDDFGSSFDEQRETIIIDYSSPNAAKKLHAGHIRSTILGEVLARLHESVGATVYRLNHLNDLGGFGFLLEGYRRWHTLLSPEGNQNDRLAELYVLFRTLEKLSEDPRASGAWSDEERATVMRCFPGTSTKEDFLQAWQEFVRASDAQYQALEAGDESVVAQWAAMVQWSLEDFSEFYNLLKINHDFTLGESFYAHNGRELIELARAANIALVFDEHAVQQELRWIQGELAQGTMTEAEGASYTESVKGDYNATVVPLSHHRRLVVLRRDGSTIYATRDLGAIRYRSVYFSPTRMLYVVGQEQADHFKDVFEAASLLGIAGNTKHEHISHGLYVDAATKKRLSSRAGAASVIDLLKGTIAHFEKKFMNDGVLEAHEAARAAKELGIGSIVVHDVKKDKKTSVEINVDLTKTVEEFEKSGGAYLIYAACRAQSILRKFGKAVPSVSAFSDVTLEPQEVELLKRIADYPQRVKNAAKNDDPSILVQALFEIARQYSSYYNAVPVLKGGEVVEYRVVITAAVASVLKHGLKICNVDCPERI